MKIVSLLLVQEPRFKNAEFCILNYVCIQSLNKIYLALPWLVLWSSDVKNWLIGKDSDAGKDWRQEENGMTEDKMVECHHQLKGHGVEQALGVDDG